VPFVLVIDVFDPGEERGELLDRLPRLGALVHEVLEVVSHVVERDLLVPALGAQTIHSLHAHPGIRSGPVTG
jgi:hypothetical protein